MVSDYKKPLNIGSDEMVSMNEMAEIVLELSGKNLPIKHIPGPEGVRGRNSDNTLIKKVLGWAPNTSIREGLKITHAWIASKVQLTFFDLTLFPLFPQTFSISPTSLLLTLPHTQPYPAPSPLVHQPIRAYNLVALHVLSKTNMCRHAFLSQFCQNIMLIASMHVGQVAEIEKNGGSLDGLTTSKVMGQSMVDDADKGKGYEHQ